MEIFEREDIVSHVRKAGAYLTEKLDALTAKSDVIEERRGIGLIQGLKVRKPVGEFINKALEKGLLIISAKDNVIRLVPPLIIEEKHIDEMMNILESIIK